MVGGGEARLAFVFGSVAAAEGEAEDLVGGLAFGQAGEAGGKGGRVERGEKEVEVGVVGAVGAVVRVGGALIPGGLFGPIGSVNSNEKGEDEEDLGEFGEEIRRHG